MKISIPKEGNMVCQHFGHSPEFAIVTIEDGKAVKYEVIANPGHEPGLLPRLMSEHGVERVIAGGMGKKAIEMLEGLGIKVSYGASGPLGEVVEKYLKGELKAGDNLCDH